MRGILTVLVVVVLVSPVLADTYYVRGDLNGWSTANPMTDNGDGSYSATIDTSGQTLGNTFQFKAANDGWSVNGPPNNAQLRYINGAITFNFFPNFVDDGWMPPAAWWPSRLGWNATTGWELMGSPNGWGTPLATLTNMGGDLFQADIVIPAAGHSEFKFRAAGDWDINIGNTFAWNDANIGVDTANADQTVRFQLDLPHGRWRTTLVPEPMSLLLALLGLALRRR
jgi:hypothetical protein